MKISIISFSGQGAMLADCIGELLANESAARGEAWETEIFALKKYASIHGHRPVEHGLSAWCRERWDMDDLMIFVGASGIAVRTIAPCIKSKTTDPAVLVLDERGSFVISLLSGHLGGANEWTAFLAEKLSATAVITTATDVEGKFAVDVWAQRNHLQIDSMKLAKEISAAVLAGRRVGFYCTGLVEGIMPEELMKVENPEDWLYDLTLDDICGTPEERVLMAVTPLTGCLPESGRILKLIPSCITVGIGCRKGKEPHRVEEKVKGWLTAAAIDLRSLEKAASIDLKKEEEGILALCRKLDIPFCVYSSQELIKVPGEFTPSKFVSGITGVDNVCERSAMACCEGGALIMKKQAGDGVTAAAALRTWRVRF